MINRWMLTESISLFQAEALGQPLCLCFAGQNIDLTHSPWVGLVTAVDMNHTKRGQWVRPGHVYSFSVEINIENTPPSLLYPFLLWRWLWAYINNRWLWWVETKGIGESCKLFQPGYGKLKDCPQSDIRGHLPRDRRTCLSKPRSQKLRTVLSQQWQTDSCNSC